MGGVSDGSYKQNQAGKNSQGAGKKLRNQRYQAETHTCQTETENTSTFAPESHRESGSESGGKGRGLNRHKGGHGNEKRVKIINYHNQETR